jgi:hypothetical protein
MAGSSSAARSVDVTRNVRREAGIGNRTVGMKNVMKNVLSRWAWQAGKQNSMHRQLWRWHKAARNQMPYLQIILTHGMIDA